MAGVLPAPGKAPDCGCSPGPPVSCCTAPAHPPPSVAGRGTGRSFQESVHRPLRDDVQDGDGGIPRAVHTRLPLADGLLPGSQGLRQLPLSGPQVAPGGCTPSGRSSRPLGCHSSPRSENTRFSLAVSKRGLAEIIIRWRGAEAPNRGNACSEVKNELTRMLPERNIGA